MALLSVETVYNTRHGRTTLYIFKRNKNDKTNAFIIWCICTCNCRLSYCLIKIKEYDDDDYDDDDDDVKLKLVTLSEP